ncbi:hypothetical protein ACFLQU_05920 [Verrucomicrobiota bacterium]
MALVTESVTVNTRSLVSPASPSETDAARMETAGPGVLKLVTLYLPSPARRLMR